MWEEKHTSTQSLVHRYPTTNSIIHNRQKQNSPHISAPTDEWANPERAVLVQVKARNQECCCYKSERKARSSSQSETENSLFHPFCSFRSSTVEEVSLTLGKTICFTQSAVQITSFWVFENILMDTHGVFNQTSECDRSPAKPATTSATTISQ